MYFQHLEHKVQHVKMCFFSEEEESDVNQMEGMESTEVVSVGFSAFGLLMDDGTITNHTVGGWDIKSFIRLFI